MQLCMYQTCYSSGINIAFFHSLLLVVPLNVISKQWPEEYKFAEFSHHSEQRQPMLHFSMSKGKSGTEKNYAPEAELTKVPQQSNLILQTGYFPLKIVVFQMLFPCILLLKNSCGVFLILQPPICTKFRRTADLHLHLLFQHWSQEELHETSKTGLKNQKPTTTTNNKPTQPHTQTMEKESKNEKESKKKNQEKPKREL